MGIVVGVDEGRDRGTRLGRGVTDIIVQPLLQVTWVDQEPRCSYACC